MLGSIVDLLQLTPAGNAAVDLVNLIRWFSLVGMQFTLGHWEVEGSLDTCYTRVCEVNGMAEGNDGDQEHTLRGQALSAVVTSTVSVITALID